MKRSILSRGLLLAVILLMGAALYGNGNYLFYMLTYIFIFLFLLFSMVPYSFPGKRKIYSGDPVCTGFSGTDFVCGTGDASGGSLRATVRFLLSFGRADYFCPLFILYLVVLHPTVCLRFPSTTYTARKRLE